MMTKNILIKAIGEIAYTAMVADPALFVRAFDSRKPWPWQVNVLREVTERDDEGKYLHKIAGLSMPRQNSKSTISSWLASWQLYTGDNQEIVTVANDAAQASIIFRDGQHIIKNSRILYNLVDRFTRFEIRLINGNRWIIKSAESISSRGLRPSLVCYDELGWAADRELFDVLSAGQAAQLNPLTFITSTVGPVQAGIFWEIFELARSGDPNVRLLYFQENLSPLITEEFLEKQRAILPAHVYAREHMNTWGSGSEAFCTLSDWEKAVEDGDPRRTADQDPCHAFLDLGWVHDETALAVAKREREKIAIVALETWQGSQERPVSFSSIERHILELSSSFNIRKLTIESPQGVALAQRLGTIGLTTETLHPTARSNREVWGSLYTNLKNGSLCLPIDPKLRRQLLTLTIKNSTTGWKVVDDPSIHNDRAMAVAGAVRMVDIGSSNYLEWVRQQVPVRKSNQEIPLDVLVERADRALHEEFRKNFFD